MIVFTNESIDRLSLLPLDRPLGWQVHFRSAHAGWVHQLYRNGQLVDVTDTPEGRCFEISAAETPQQFTILAVDPAYRYDSFAAQLPAAVADPPWIYHARVRRTADHRPGETLALWASDGAGHFTDDPTATTPLWPAHQSHGGFGQGPLGVEGFGIAGGSITGQFGQGPFGADERLIELDVPLSQRRNYTLRLAARSPQGKTSAVCETTFEADPPPAQAVALTPTDYDATRNVLTCTLQ